MYYFTSNAVYVLKYGDILDIIPLFFEIFKLNIFEWILLFLRLYKLLMQTRLLFDQLPLFNPFIWPLSLIYDLTQPYIEFWEDSIPRFRIMRLTFDFSTLLSLELLGIVIDLFSYGAEFTLTDLNSKVNFILRKKKYSLMFKSFFSYIFKKE